MWLMEMTKTEWVTNKVQLTKHSSLVSQSVSWLVNQWVSQSVIESASQPVSEWVSESVSQSDTK